MTHHLLELIESPLRTVASVSITSMTAWANVFTSCMVCTYIPQNEIHTDPSGREQMTKFTSC